MIKILKLLPVLALVLVFNNCADDASTKLKSTTLKIKAGPSKIGVKEVYVIAVDLSENGIDSLHFPGIKPSNAKDFNKIEVTFTKLGSKRIEIIGFSAMEGKPKKAFANVEVVSNSVPKKLSFKIIETYPHNPDFYTQGLEYKDGILYESTGRNGKSKIVSYNFPAMEITQKTMLDIKYFGEGLTVVGDSIYQLTWQSKKCLIYNNQLEKTGSLNLSMAEGWGICNSGKNLFISDGSSTLYQADKSLRVTQQIPVYFGKNKLAKLNELEYVNGKVWANIYYSEQIVCINPETGAVEYFIDCSALRKLLTASMAEVLNGIAFLPERNAFLVTGKLWDKMFLIEIEGVDLL